MTLVFDTSLLIELEHKNPVIIQKVEDLAQQSIERPCITFATFAEFYFGFLKKFPHRRLQILDELDSYHILHTTRRNTLLFAELKYSLESKGTSLSIFDLLIAAIVLDAKMTLVTLDRRFTSVPELKVILL